MKGERIKYKLKPWERYDYDFDYSPPKRIIKNIYTEEAEANPADWEKEMWTSMYGDY